MAETLAAPDERQPADGGPTAEYRIRVEPLKTEQIIALLAPIVVLQVGLMVAALIDLERPERRVRGGSKAVWAIIVVLVNVIGPIVYFVTGREDV
jgi:phospholipase D-like protein